MFSIMLILESSSIHYLEDDLLRNQSNEELAKELNDEFRAVVLPVTIFVGLEFLLGLLGNFIVLFVFSFRYHACNFRYFVLCLALTDVLSSLTTVPGEIVTQLNWYVYPFVEVCKVKSFFNVFTMSAEALCLLTIAIDRYRKVCQPLRWQIKPRTAMCLCGIIYFIALLFSFPVAILWGLHKHQKLYKNVAINVTICEKDDLYKDTAYPLAYSVTIETTLSICLVVMLGLYILVAKKLVQEKRPHTSPGSPLVIITPADDNAAQSFVLCAQSDVSDTGCSSGLYKKPNVEIATKRDHVNPSIDTSLSDVGTTLTVPTVRKGHKTVTDSEQQDFTSDEETQSSVDHEEEQAFADKDQKQKSIESDHDQVSVRKEKRQAHRVKPRRSRNRSVSARVRRKTLIMFVLTIVFITTTVLYMTLLSFIARSDDVLQNMSHGGKATYFFFFRLYFLNHVINPLVYGILDPRFKRVIKSVLSAKRRVNAR